jgi:Tfp pilus assembly protein PilV
MEMRNKNIKEAGFTFVEVLIAILLMSLVGLGIFTAMAVSSKHTINADVRSTAESVARSELEYVKNLPYDAVNYPPAYTGLSIATLGLDANWTFSLSYPASRLDPKGDGTTTDDGLQKIIVTVFYKGTTVLIVQGYKLG